VADDVVEVLTVFAHTKYTLVLRLAVVDLENIADESFVVSFINKLLYFGPCLDDPRFVIKL
jgi:hypothetical protein